MVCGVCSVVMSNECGMWYVVCGVFCIVMSNECGVWCVVCGVWYVMMSSALPLQRCINSHTTI